MDKVCAFCRRGEKSLLGQGLLKCYDPTPGFNPLKKQFSRSKRTLSDTDDLSGRRSQHHLTWRRARGPIRHNRSFNTLALALAWHLICIGKIGRIGCYGYG